MDKQEQQHQKKLREVYLDRLRILQITEARYGYNCPPEVQTEIEDINEKLEAINKKIGLSEDTLNRIELQEQLQSIETIDISAKSLISWYSKLDANERERQAEQLYYGKYVRWNAIINSIFLIRGRVVINAEYAYAFVKIENFLHHPYNPGPFRRGVKVIMLGKIAVINKGAYLLPGSVFLNDCYIMEI